MLKKFALVILIVSGLYFTIHTRPQEPTGAPPYGESEDQVPELDPYSWLRNWERPAGPAKVALQVGHWKNAELPNELEKLRGNTGSSGGGKAEWEVNLTIAELTKNLLAEKNILVEIVPATVPPQLWADVFIAIHADGSLDKRKSGYKASHSWRDFSGKAGKLVQLIEKNYKAATKLTKDDNISHNMRGYYAFSWWRYEHAVHPMTTAAILETGFLTSPADRKIIVAKPEISAQGLADGIVEYLKDENLLD